jgi:hypothetical protein
VKYLQLPFKMTTILSGFLTILCLLATTVTYLAAQETIAIIAHIIVWFILAAGIIAAILLILDRIQWFRLRRTEFHKDQCLAKNEARQANIESDRQYMRMVAEAKLLGATLKQVERGMIHPAALSDGKFSSFPTQVINQIEAAQQLPSPSDNSLIFEDVATKALTSRGAGRFIAFGGMGSGKTTLAKHTMRLANEIIGRQGGQVFIIDPHAPKTIWGDGITVIGAGMDYTSIRGFLDHVKSDVKARYQAGCGDDTQPLPEPYKPNFIICEEWTGVIFALRAMKMWEEDDIRTFYMDSRKAGWGFLLVSHEHTTKALGLDRLGNLLSGIEYFITLDKDSVTETYNATLGRSFRDKEPYPLKTPGPFYGPMIYTSAEAEAERAKADKYPTFNDLTFVVAEPEPSRDEAKVIKAYETLRDGAIKFSWRKATEAAYGAGKFGKGPNDKLRSILDKFDIDYSEFINE